MRRCIFLAMILFLFLAPWAYGTVIYDLKINEVCPIHAQGIVENDPGAWIEMYNPLDVNVSTAGLAITDSGLNTLAELPVIIIPPDGYLLIQLGDGIDDLDGSDGVAIFNARLDGTLRMAWEAGAVALFRGPVGVVENLRDFVAWGTEPLDGAAAEVLAVVADMWTDGFYVDLTGLPIGSSFGLAVPGYDEDTESPWATFTGRYDSGLQTPATENILMSFPRPGEVFLDDPLNGNLPASWVSTEFPTGATTYQVELRYRSAGGDWQGIYEEETVETSAELPIANAGEYAWRVTPCRDGAPLAEVQEQMFYRARDVGVHVELDVPFLENLKDTKMLCAYDLATATRPGCNETLWNVPHDPGSTNDHDVFYSARASIAMINHFFGGDLSQDRISYEVFKDEYPGAEGDLGHGVGFRTWQVTSTLRWALGDISTNYAPYAPPFDYLRGEIEAGNPVLITSTPGGNNREGMVITSYAIHTLYNDGPPMPSVKVLDPRSAAPYWVLYSFFTPTIAAHWGINGEPVGILQDGGVAIDEDDDGIVSFDESPGNDRFGSSATEPDSDGDDIGDLNEIYCYTFHDAMHEEHGNDAPGFSDVDGDGLRAEADTDSDDGGAADGLEDLDHDGFAPEAGETCPHLDSDDSNAPTDPTGIEDPGLYARLRLARLPSEGNATCRFRIELPQADVVTLDLLTIEGRRIASLESGTLSSGAHEVTWDGRDAGGHPIVSGVYLVRLTTEHNGNLSGKIPIVR